MMTDKLAREKYPFVYETHMHTCEGSQCGQNTGEEMAKAYKAAGYDGIIITDHHIGGNCRPDRSLPWDEWVSQFFSGYRNAKATGDKIGLKVFCGWESGFNATEFLIYGLDEEWMKKHPELRDCTVEEQYSIIHSAGGMVIHAHPYRKRFYIPEIRLFPDFVDGVEAVNAANSHDGPGSYGYDPKNEMELANPRAFEYANKHNFPTTAGSDMHVNHPFVGKSGERLSGMHFEKPLNSINDYIEAVLSHGKTNDYILCDEIHYFSKTGEILD